MLDQNSNKQTTKSDVFSVQKLNPISFFSDQKSSVNDHSQYKDIENNLTEVPNKSINYYTNFLQNGADNSENINSFPPSEDQNPLIQAVESNNTSVVASLLVQKVDTNVKSNKGLTPLHIAILNNNLLIIDLLLENGANPNTQSLDQSRTALHYAYVQNCSDEVINLLLKYNASNNIKDKYNKIPSDYQLNKSNNTLNMNNFDKDSLALSNSNILKGTQSNYNMTTSNNKELLNYNSNTIFPDLVHENESINNGSNANTIIATPDKKDELNDSLENDNKKSEVNIKIKDITKEVNNSENITENENNTDNENFDNFSYSKSKSYYVSDFPFSSMKKNEDNKIKDKENNKEKINIDEIDIKVSKGSVNSRNVGINDLCGFGDNANMDEIYKKIIMQKRQSFSNQNKRALSYRSNINNKILNNNNINNNYKGQNYQTYTLNNAKNIDNINLFEFKSNNFNSMSNNNENNNIMVFRNNEEVTQFLSNTIEHNTIDQHTVNNNTLNNNTINNSKLSKYLNSTNNNLTDLEINPFNQSPKAKIYDTFNNTMKNANRRNQLYSNCTTQPQSNTLNKLKNRKKFQSEFDFENKEYLNNLNNLNVNVNIDKHMQYMNNNNFNNINNNDKYSYKNYTTNDELINDIENNSYGKVSDFTIQNNNNTKINSERYTIDNNTLSKSSENLITKWLDSIDLLNYLNIFIQNEYYDIKYLIQSMRSNESRLKYENLEKIGIKKPGDIYKILTKLEVDAGLINNKLVLFIYSNSNYYIHNKKRSKSSMNYSQLNNVNLQISNEICCGCFNNTKKIEVKNDLKSFLKRNNLLNFYPNFTHNGFDNIEFILLQMYSSSPINEDIIENYLHIYDEKDRLSVLTALKNEVKKINLFVCSKEFNDNPYKYKYYNLNMEKEDEMAKNNEGGNGCNIF